MSPGAQNPQARPESRSTTDYFGVALRAIPPNVPLPFDVYLLVADKLTRFRSIGDAIVPDRLVDLSRFAVRTAYIPLDQKPKYREFLWQWVSRPELTAEQKLGAAGQLTYLHVEGVFTAAEVPPLVAETIRAVRDLQQIAFSGSVGIAQLAAALPLYENPQYQHAVRTAVFTMAFARHVWDRDDDRVWHAGVAALLHDLGERQVSPQSLAGQDWRSEAKEEYRRHPQLALDCLPIAHLPGEIVSGILQHHESYDGTGFPDRRRGPQICLTARMLAIGDTFDRVISPSPDSPAILPPHEAVRLMESVLPGKFDPKLLTVFVKAL